MDGKKFRPGRGKLAIKKDALDDTTSAGIIIKPKENVKWITGVVASVGDPNILPNGTEQECLVIAGDRVLLSREKGYAELGGFVIIDQECVMAILDKEVTVS